MKIKPSVYPTMLYHGAQYTIVNNEEEFEALKEQKGLPDGYSEEEKEEKEEKEDPKSNDAPKDPEDSPPKEPEDAPKDETAPKPAKGRKAAPVEKPEI